MAKTKRTMPALEGKLCKVVQALFIPQARQLGMGNAEIRAILGVDKTEVNAVAKLVNKALKKGEKQKE